MTRPLAVSERKAAKMLDITPAKFRELREQGILPPPTSLGDLKLWRVADLERVLNREAALPESARFEV